MPGNPYRNTSDVKPRKIGDALKRAEGVIAPKADPLNIRSTIFTRQVITTPSIFSDARISWQSHKIIYDQPEHIFY